MISHLVLIGVLTWYAGPYVSGPLRCGSIGGASGIYDTTHEWIAVDMDRYGWKCNDLVKATVEGELFYWRVRDSGPLANFCVYFGDTCVPIVADLPAHVFMWPGLSVQGTIENVTGGLRAVGEWDRTEDRQEVER